MNYDHSLHKCNEETCQVCRGGLAFCEVCSGGEGSLPTSCPGRTMTSEEGDEVYGARRDWAVIAGHRVELVRAHYQDPWQEAARSVTQRLDRPNAAPVVDSASDAQLGSYARTFSSLTARTDRA